MGAGKAGFILKVISTKTKTQLKQYFHEKINSNAYDGARDLTHRKGFINFNVAEPQLADTRPHVHYLYKSPEKLEALYREYIGQKIPFSDELSYRVVDTNVIIDFNKKTCIICSTTTAEVNKIIKLFFPESDNDNVGFRKPIYVNDELFFRWLIDNSKNNRAVFPPSCKLTLVQDAKVKDIEDAFSYTQTAKIGATEHLSDSELYTPIRHVGVRDSLFCFFTHSGVAIPVTVHRTGKITIRSRPEGIDDDQYYGIFSVVLEEMENLHRSYHSILQGGA
jgi:hypothetical protein